MVHIETLKPVHEQDDIKVLWNRGVHKDREITAIRPDMNKNKKKENIHTDRCGSTS